MKFSTTTSWRFIFFLFTFFIVALPAMHTLYAQESTIPTGTFSLQPAKVELSILPGENKTEIIQIANGTALPLSVVVSFEDIAPKPQKTAIEEPVTLLGGISGQHPLRELLATPKKTLQLLPGETAGVPVTVSIPRLMSPGGHYGSVVFTFQPIFSKESVGPQNISVESRLATLFFVRVAGEVKEEGMLAEFGLFNKEKYLRQPGKDKPLRFQIAYTNRGTVHLNPYGRLIVSPLIGDEVTVEIDPWVVLPDTTRMREINMHDALYPGYYTATLLQNRGYEDIVDERKVAFVVLPNVAQATFMLLGLLGFAWLVRRSLRLSRNFISSTKP